MNNIELIEREEHNPSSLTLSEDAKALAPWHANTEPLCHTGHTLVQTIACPCIYHHILM